MNLIQSVPKPTRKKRKVKMTEADLQRQCEDFLDKTHTTYYRIPDELYRSVFASYNNIPVYIKKAIADYIKGKPDLLILFTNGSYVCVELKSETGRQTHEQKMFQKAVGYDNYFVIRTLDDFVELINKYRS